MVAAIGPTVMCMSWFLCSRPPLATMTRRPYYDVAMCRLTLLQCQQCQGAPPTNVATTTNHNYNSNSNLHQQQQHQQTTANKRTQPQSDTHTHTPSTRTPAARAAKAASPVGALPLERQRPETNNLQATSSGTQVQSN